jgi:putative transcriptional regulator
VTGPAAGPRLRRALAVLSLACLSLTGRSAADDVSILLIADPEMGSPVFSRSVVLVAPHGRGAALGVILNHPLPGDPSRAYPDDALLREVDKLYFGGPVDTDRFVFLFRSSEPPEDALHLFADVYLSDNRELLARQLQIPRERSGLQVYVGHSGWAPGQLQMEILHGAWLTREVDLELLFETDRGSIWEQLYAEEIPEWI